MWQALHQRKGLVRQPDPEGGHLENWEEGLGLGMPIPLPLPLLYPPARLAPWWLTMGWKRKPKWACGCLAKSDWEDDVTPRMDDGSQQRTCEPGIGGGLPCSRRELFGSGHMDCLGGAQGKVDLLALARTSAGSFFQKVHSSLELALAHATKSQTPFGILRREELQDSRRKEGQSQSIPPASHLVHRLLPHQEPVILHSLWSLKIGWSKKPLIEMSAAPGYFTIISPLQGP